MRRARLLALPLLLAAACSSPAEDEPTGVVGPVEAEPAFVDGELRIELEPNQQSVVLPILGPEPPTNVDDIVYDSSLVLAFGSAYPSAFRLQLTDVYTTCMLPADYQIEEIEAPAELHAVAQGGDLIEIAPESEGELELIVRGSASYDTDEACAFEGGDGSSMFEIRVRVHVVRPASVLIEPPDSCQDSAIHYLESGARMSRDWLGLRVSLLDAEGAPIYASNVSGARPITLTVRAAPGTLLGMHDEALGLAALVAKGDPTTIEVDSELGPAFDFELIESGSIDAMDIQFNLMGVAGGGIPDLTSGQTYGPAFARTSSSIDVTTLGLYTDGERLCTGPSPLSFELRTSTPATCAVFAQRGHGDISVGQPTGVSADVHASGACALELRAPLFADGEGLAEDLSVTFVGAEGLLSIGEGR